MPQMELAAINKKIEQTRAEIDALGQRSSNSLQAIMIAELQRRLETLLEEKREMESVSSKETVSLRMYGDTVERGKVSSRVLLSALGGFQSMLDSVANALLHSPTSVGKIPGYIRDITEFEVVGTFAGSFGLILEHQVSQTMLSSSDGDLDQSLSEMFGVLEAMDNSEQLLTSITPFGNRAVSHYRKWIDDLREDDVNLEIDWKNSSAASRKLHLLKENAPRIISTLETIDKIDSSEVILKGTLNGVNVRNHSFEMSVKGHGLVKGTALPETLMAVVDKIGTEVSAKVLKSISFTKAGVEKLSWYMIGTD